MLALSPYHVCRVQGEVNAASGVRTRVRYLAPSCVLAGEAKVIVVLALSPYHARRVQGKLGQGPRK